MIRANHVNKRLMGFQAFWEDYKPTVLASEIQLHHKDIPFCGTADFVGIITDKKTNKADITLIDYKTGMPYKTHEVQLSAYAMIWNKLFPKYKITKVAGLYLKDSWIKKPTYTLKYYNIDYGLVKNVYDLWVWNNSDARGNTPKPLFPKKFPTKFSLTRKDK
tara:strand:- start:228 stop:713 length:486 start_codon:yes stop_codon:yes gene_type:complete